MMNNSIKWISSIIMLIAMCNCTDLSRNPFDEAIDYYAAMMDIDSTCEDTLKWQAAKFLKEYSEYQYGVPRHIVNADGDRAYLDYTKFSSDTAYRKFLDNNGFYLEVKPKVRDTDTITVKFLIDNIEMAFDSWNKPWAHDVSFDDFCTYILPYRNGDEELSDWRMYFKNKYESTIEDSVEILSIRNVAQYLIRRLKEEVAYGTRLGTFYQNSLLTPADMEMFHTLECKALAHYGTLALRACGVPCALIETNWRFTEIVHNSILIPQVGNNEHACRLSIYDELQEMGTAKDSMATWRSWIYTYEANLDLLELNKSKDSGTIRFSEPVTRTDITSIFSTTHDFSRCVPKEHRDRKHLFLCRFHNWKWYPIREGRVDGDSVYFKDATIRQLYRLGCMDGDMLTTFGEMFTITGDNEQLNYNCTGDSVTFHLNVECRPEEWMTEKDITIYLGGDNGEWEPYIVKGLLWSINEKTVEYRLFDESLRGTFKPIFHQITIRLPKHTVFTHDLYPRPIGYLFEDTIANEGHFMSF